MRLTNARIQGGSNVDIFVDGTRIVAVEPHAGAAGDIDLGGGLILPGLIDGHVHLDKTLLGLPWRAHDAGGTVRDRIENERRVRPLLAKSVQERGGALVRQMSAHGTVALRTHADIDDTIGLANLHAVLEIAARFRDVVDMQVVAFPQSGVVSRPGVADLLDAALREGAGFVGGVDPESLDGDAAGQLDVVFGLAARHGAGIDIHLHDQGARGNAQLRDVAARTQAAGMSGRVTVSHAFSLGTPDAADFAATADALAAAGVAILTSAPGAAPMPPVLALRGRGVTVFAGSDNIRDLWSPFGNGDMLERAWFVAQRQGFRTDADIATAVSLCSGEAAKAMGIEPRALTPGAPADFMVLRAETSGRSRRGAPGRAHGLEVRQARRLRVHRAARPQALKSRRLPHCTWQAPVLAGSGAQHGAPVSVRMRVIASASRSSTGARLLAAEDDELEGVHEHLVELAAALAESDRQQRWAARPSQIACARLRRRRA